MPEKEITFAIGITTDGRVLFDFNMEPVDHLKLTPEAALDLAETLIDTARQARAGRVIITPYTDTG